MDRHIYIDGSNLYYSPLRGTPYKWLDLERFCGQMLPKNTIRKIYYFTAKVDARPHDPDQPTRRLAYLNALAALPQVEAHIGTFITLVVNQVVIDVDPATDRYLWRGVKPIIKLDAADAPEKVWASKSEEKESDVNLAAHLLRDFYRRTQWLASSHLSDPVATAAGTVHKPANR